MNNLHLTTEWFFLKRYDNFLTAIVMQSCALNNDSLSEDAPFLNALPTRNFKCQFDSRYLTSIYKVKTGSVKKNFKLFISRCSLFWSPSCLLKNSFLLRIGNMFPSEKARLFPIFKRRKIVQKHRKTSYFLAAIVDIAIPQEKPVVQNIKWDLRKSGNRVLSMPCRQIRVFSLLFLAIQTTFAFKFSASVLMNK